MAVGDGAIRIISSDCPSGGQKHVTGIDYLTYLKHEMSHAGETLSRNFIFTLKKLRCKDWSIEKVFNRIKCIYFMPVKY